MPLEGLADALGDERLGVLGGAAIGLVFGFLAQRSAFCLRAATLEVARLEPGARLAVWLLVFAAALLGTQLLIMAGQFDTGEVRALNSRGSVSGAVVGGLMFGAGMVLTRACATRMLVVASTGNLRALLSGLVFAVTAQASLTGVLEPARTAIGELWTVGAGERDLLAIAGVGTGGAVLFALGWLAAGVLLAVASRASPARAVFGVGVGLTIAAAWWFTYQQAAVSFEPASVHSLSFSGPSADALMYVLSPPGAPLTFDLGLLPGVALGAFLGGLVGRELRLEGFQGGAGMPRYILGGLLMGFGGVLAGGCAVGAGVSGASVFALTAWLVLWSMWIGAVVTDRLVDGAPRGAPGPAVGVAS